MKRMSLLAALGASLIAGAIALPVAAQGTDTKAVLAKLKPKDFPSQPIEFTVVYPAGGGMDVTARLLAKYVEKVSGERIVVNNRTGGAGMVGHAYLATQAKPDGYTVGIIANLVWGDAMLRAQGKWSYTDLEPVGYINSDALTWIGQTDGALKGRSLKDVLQIARDKPSTLRVAIVPGSMWEYLVEQLETASGGKFLRVPFQGGGPGITALVGGNVDIAQGFLAEYRGHLEAGKVAPIAVAAGARLVNQKDVATFNEVLGASDYVWNVIRFAVTPKGTPADRKAYLGAIMKAAMQDPELIEEYRKAGAFFDATLAGSASIATDLDKYATRERDFYQKSGRLK
ncbi:MAG: tripartite tricarboxylate transporter substrate binding protein [Betaproteobacteria bacterium]|nr:tripartite tricarboxylate transporter substrate binding protein [Betaproteobacteria bacterium]